MKNSTKIGLCAIVLAVAIATINLATPVAHVAVNSTIVSQMDNTNTSYIAAQSAGNGEGWLKGIVLVVAGGLIGFILTRKGNS
jgi:hypothetical protein